MQTQIFNQQTVNITTLQQDTFKLCTQIVHTLNSQNLILTTAESCTGGMLSQNITAISGASNCFNGGICTYSDNCKINLLNIPADIIHTHTAVSHQCATYMAQNSAKLFNAHFALSTTGYAGPTGGDIENPKGTIYISLSTPTQTIVQKLYFPNLSRDEIRYFVTNYAFKLLLQNL